MMTVLRQNILAKYASQIYVTTIGIQIVPLGKWAYENGVTLDFSRPEKPTDNPFIESFNGSLRDEDLNTNWFISPEDAQEKIET